MFYVPKGGIPQRITGGISEGVPGNISGRTAEGIFQGFPGGHKSSENK